MIFRRANLHSKLVPVQYREYEYGLLRNPGALTNDLPGALLPVTFIPFKHHA